MSSKEMSPTTLRLYYYMLSRKGQDVPIIDMHKVITLSPKAQEPEDVDGSTARRQQQHVGSYVSRVNARAKDIEIVPGELKRTYRAVLKKT